MGSDPGEAQSCFTHQGRRDGVGISDRQALGTEHVGTREITAPLTLAGDQSRRDRIGIAEGVTAEQRPAVANSLIHPRVHLVGVLLADRAPDEIVAQTGAGGLRVESDQACRWQVHPIRRDLIVLEWHAGKR